MTMELIAKALLQRMKHAAFLFWFMLCTEKLYGKYNESGQQEKA